MNGELTTRILAVCLAMALLPANGLGLDGSYRRELEMATLQLMDAAIRADEQSLMAARARIERAVPAAVAAGDREAIASARFYLAFASWIGVSTGMSGDADPVGLIRAALADLDAAMAAKGEYAQAHMLAVMCLVTLFRFGGADANTGAAIGAHIKRAKELDPNDPRAGIFGGMMAAYDPAGPAKPEGVQRLEDVCTALERERQAPQPRVADWWDVTALVWLGMVYLAGDPPDAEKARAAFEKALALRPDAVTARSLIGATDQRAFVAPEPLRAARWTLISEDPQGDGKVPTGVDARSLSIASTAGDERVWFRFEAYGAISPKSVGVNLVIDVDGDQSNGMAWWGGKPDFKFDRLVTVWITSTDGIRYRGYVGVAEARAAQTGQFTVIAQNDVDVAIDPSTRSLFVGVKRGDLGATAKSVIRGAMGSHLLWNDDVPEARLVVGSR